MSTCDTVENGNRTRKTVRTRRELGPIERVRTWCVDFIDLPTEELIKLCFDIFQDMCPHEFAIPDDVVIQFLTAVASHYRANPYHTFLHACYVLHSVWMILTTTALPRYLLPHEKLALFIAAICHDVDHDGYTNRFHVSSRSEMARRYNDIRNCAMLQTLPKGLQTEIREVVIQYIMSTDMSSHGSLVSELCQLELPEAGENGHLIECSAHTRTLLGKTILHASDLSNPARSFDVDFFMAERVQAEFRNQAKREKELGLEVTAHMDIQTEAMKYEGEVNFIDYVVKPLWERLAQLFPSLNLCLHQMRVNRDQFTRLAELARSREVSTANQTTRPPSSDE